MTGYYVLVPGMTVPQLQRFVRRHMPTAAQLRQRAQRARLPKQCRHCGEALSAFIESYRRVPSSDLTIRFIDLNGQATVSQLSSGGHDCRKIKDGLRLIVQRHLAKALRAAGQPCDTRTF